MKEKTPSAARISNKPTLRFTNSRAAKNLGCDAVDFQCSSTSSPMSRLVEASSDAGTEDMVFVYRDDEKSGKNYQLLLGIDSEIVSKNSDL